MSDELTSSNAAYGQEDYSRKVSKGALILTLSKATSYFIAFASLLVLARLLSPDDFGTIALATAIVGVAAALFDVPVTQALISIKEPTRSDFDTAWTISLIRATLVATCLCIIAFPLSEFFDTPHIAPVVIVLSAQQILFALRNPYFERFARVLDYSKDAWVEIGSKLTQVAASVAIAFIWKSYWAFVAGMLISAAFGMIATYIVSQERPKFSLRSTRHLLSFSVWLAFGALVNKLGDQSSNFIAANAFGRAVLGQIAVGTRLSTEVSQFMLVPIVRSLYSAFSRMASETERLKRAFLKAQATVFAVVMPIGVGIGLVAEYMLPLLLGDGWTKSILVVQFLAPTVGLMVVTSPTRAIGMALNRTRLLFYRDLLTLIGDLICLFVGTYYFGFVGFLTAICLGCFIQVAINLHVLRELIGVTIGAQLMNIGRSLVSAATMCATVVTLQTILPPGSTSLHAILVTAGLAISGALTYVATHLALWSINRPDNSIETFALQTANKLLSGMRRSK